MISGQSVLCSVLMNKLPAEKALQIKVSAQLKKDIRRVALERDVTVRTLILRALRSQGVSISDDELVDRRKGIAR